MTTTNERLHYMDNLRAIIMIIGVFYHAALAYNASWSSIWFSADTVQSLSLELLSDFLHVWRMPIFFVVSGFFTAMLIQRRGMGGMFKNRFLRVFWPFVIFWPLLLIAYYVAFLWAIKNIENKSAILELMAMPGAPEATISLMHLWFLYYLMIFYVLTWVFRQLPLTKIKHAIVEMNPLLAIMVLPLFLIPGLTLSVIHIRGLLTFTPEIWGVLFFGMFFAYGYILFSSSRLLDYFDRSWPILFITALVISAPMLYMFPAISFDPSRIPVEFIQPDWNIRIPLILCIAYVATLMSVVGLVVAKKILNGNNGFMRYMSDASYWIYIIHVPILLMIQFWLLDQEGGAAYKFLFSSFSTLLICLISYVLLVRWSPIGWLLNGKRKPLFSN